MVVIANPTIFEIEEMLEYVSKRHKLADILPDETPDMSYAEALKIGWCYLWYDEDTLEPLGYTAFSFVGRWCNPYFLFGTTPFAKPEHLFVARRAMLNVMNNSINKSVRVYIENDNERVQRLATISGFRRSAIHNNIWIRKKR
jgi:hypothetical protein